MNATTLRAAMTLSALGLGLASGIAAAQSAGKPGTQEFGLTDRQFVQAIEKVEMEIEKCMRAQGFQYIAADVDTVRNGMHSDKRMPGLSEEEFIDRYGFGLSTMYSGLPPQLVDGYSPGRVGLGERNVAIYKGLSAADQVAYNRALLGTNTDATFAVSFEIENFSRTGGCTRKGIEQAFSTKQLAANYYNPMDELINKDPRMKAALRKYAIEMRKAGFDYAHPDEVAPDIEKRIAALTQDRTIELARLTPEQLKGLKALQDYERRVAKKDRQLRESLFDPVEEQIQREMYSRKVN
ncbi:MAG: hypothetical protein AB3X44_19880 [Leptothrix sp. (in: b-proteobacteria)]